RILCINEAATLHMGPAYIIVTLSVDFVDGIDSSELESAVTEISDRVKRLDPAIQRVFVEAERGADPRAHDNHPPGKSQ
ncbi:MAG: hypothetical protein O7E57_10560, partial [Gammaproteobacteria bacterium]|nr:hypothetical protein [Gammaproteobacteria bacterium]